jgi:antitoxin component YwqK of YwqJK toxin-antitoxin module
MKELKIILATWLVVASAMLAGCKSEYDSSEVIQRSQGSAFNDEYTEKKSGDKISGTVVTKRGDKVTRIVEVEDGKPNGDWTSYFDNGKIEQHVTLKAGIIVGVRKTFCENNPDQIKWSEDHSSEIIAYFKFDCTTGLTLEEQYRKGSTQVGVWKTWTVADGKQIPASVVTYNDEGKKEGVEEKFFKDGRLESSETYKNGDLDGPFKEFVFYDDGKSRLKNEGIKKGFKTIEEKQYQTETTYPEGTLLKQVIPLWDGGYVQADYDKYRVRISKQRGDSQNAKSAAMIWEKVVSTQKPDQKDFENLQYLVESTKVNLNDVYGNGWYTGLQGDHLITTASEENYDMLVSMGLDPNGTNFDGSNRLMQCLMEERKCSFDHMLRLANDYVAAGVKSKTLFGGTTAGYFCSNLTSIRDPRKYELFSLLLKLDDVSQPNNAGWTPLHFCAAQQDLTAAKMLLQAGANASVKNNDGFTPLQMAFVSSRGNQFSLKWTVASVKEVGELAKGTTFNYSDKLPMFNKSLKDIFLENGDAESSKLADSFN